VSRAQLTKLEGLFQAMDIGGDAGVIFCSDVLNTVDVVKSPFTDHVFEMIGVNPAGTLQFSELCRILMTYCVFSRGDIL
ncbi:unnamed protein product, partial [Sphacelaria rigidula]